MILALLQGLFAKQKWSVRQHQMRGGRVRKIANVVAAVAVLIGLVWILQGASVLGGSFMTGQSQWLYIGVAVAAAGIAGLMLANRRGR